MRTFAIAVGAALALMVIGAGAVVATGHELGVKHASVLQSTGHERAGASPSASCAEDVDEDEGAEDESPELEADEEANECEGDNHQGNNNHQGANHQSETSAEQKGTNEQEGQNNHSKRSDQQEGAQESGSSGQRS